MRIVRVLRPRYIMFENVPGLLRGGDRLVAHGAEEPLWVSWMGTVLGELADCGYDAQWQGLRRAMQSQIERIRCPSCKYVLLGQRVSGGAVICPECGAPTTLMHLGITEADLIPPTDGSEPVVDT